MSPLRRALCGDWRDLALPDRPYDGLIGDGSFNVLTSPAHIGEVAERLRPMAPGAMLAVRCFITPDADGAERVEDLADWTPLGGFHAYKWRLAMALYHERGTGRWSVSHGSGRWRRCGNTS